MLVQIYCEKIFLAIFILLSLIVQNQVIASEGHQRINSFQDPPSRDIILSVRNEGTFAKYYQLDLDQVSLFLPWKIPVQDTYLLGLATKRPGIIPPIISSLNFAFVSHPTQKHRVTIDDFFRVFHSGKKFNFIINESQLIFTSTGWAWRDIKSKHVFLANGSPYVRYAGEMWVSMKHPYTLIINNNSGSYQPSPELLPSVRNLLGHFLSLNYYKNFQIKLAPEHFPGKEEKERWFQNYGNLTAPEN